MKLGRGGRYTELPFTPQFACTNGLMTDEPCARSIAVYTWVTKASYGQWDSKLHDLRMEKWRERMIYIQNTDFARSTVEQCV